VDAGVPIKAPPPWFRQYAAGGKVPPKAPPQQPINFFIGDTAEVPVTAEMPATTDVQASVQPHEQQQHDRVPAESKVVRQPIAPVKAPPSNSTSCKLFEDVSKIQASLEMLNHKVDRLCLAVDRLANPSLYVDC
jgi:hypothetical protein